MESTNNTIIQDEHPTVTRSHHLVPLDHIGSYDVRPGFFEINGAIAIPCGVSFTIHSHNATSCELCLFKRNETVPYEILPFPPHYKIGNVYSMIVFGLDIGEFEYAYHLDGPYDTSKGLLFNKENYLIDPYSKAITGQSVWGYMPKEGFNYKARVVRDDFDWGSCKQPLIPLQDLVIYEMHVRGFTQHESSGVKYPGTFEGLIEKIPYLKSLGVNAVELMPIFEFDEMRGQREHNGNALLDYWGYNPVSFFAPNTGYAAGIEYNREGNELKQLSRVLKENGMEVILDVVFNHTAEGDEHGPCFSFKGFDNNIYYMLTPNGKYYNFSGCGNTLNCNHPIVQQMILECLRYWVTAYRVDGFRFDLASILGRNEDGSPMNKPPLLQSLAFDPILGSVKLIAEAWDAGGLYQVGSFPSWNRWAEWNGKYRDDIRGFLKGGLEFAAVAAQRITGSYDIYDPVHRGENVSVNFITCHDGFTLYDLYSYSEKHNLENGWNDTDGTDDNRSWNCGVEGETDNIDIINLRKKLIKNACAVLMCSRGTPMFLAGDEFCNTQYGNNNPYCQDNIISWLDWTFLEKNKDIFDFFKFMIAFRKEHSVIRKTTEESTCGFPHVSTHGSQPWVHNYEGNSSVVGAMFAGRNSDDTEDDIVYVAINSFWEKQHITLPNLPINLCWRMAVDTSEVDASKCIPQSVGSPMRYIVGELTLAPRSVAVFIATLRGH